MILAASFLPLPIQTSPESGSRISIRDYSASKQSAASVEKSEWVDLAADEIRERNFHPIFHQLWEINEINSDYKFSDRNRTGNGKAPRILFSSWG